MARISRRKLANYATDRLAHGDARHDIVRQLAAYLVESGRTKELELIVRDIEIAALARGTAQVRVVAARPLSAEAKGVIEAFVKQQYSDITNVQLSEIIDTSQIGGVRIELPDTQLDATVKTKLEKLVV